MKIIGVIPARYKSSRFMGKPLALIKDKPMVWWVYRQAKQVEAFEDVYVATDNDQIYKTCVKYGINVLMTSENCVTGTDRIGEVAGKIDADLYVNIQGDEPLIEPATIETVIKYAKMHPDIQVINTMTKIIDDNDIADDSVVKVVATDDDDLIYLSRSSIPYPKKGQKIQYYRHLGLYGITKEALKFFANAERTSNEKIEDIEMLRFLENGYKIKILKVESTTIGVDRPEDIEKVEKLLTQHMNNDKN